uniref:Uncharacterized protein n=1 Tax=Daphnia galeata TaxID=27404 RepID=A0A8J2RFB9_9CRUS|nr:unnamed protein product [Daphnia galeata]
MLIRKPRGSFGPITVGIVLLIGVAAGSYIWGPTLQHYMNTDPEILYCCNSRHFVFFIKQLIEISQVC